MTDMKISVFLICLAAFAAQAQVGIGTNNPHPSAILDVQSQDKGVLLPRVALESRTQVLGRQDSVVGVGYELQAERLLDVRDSIQQQEAMYEVDKKRVEGRVRMVDETKPSWMERFWKRILE